MMELEADRMDYQNNNNEGATTMPDAFQTSIKMLDAARKQILGY